MKPDKKMSRRKLNKIPNSFRKKLWTQIGLMSAAILLLAALVVSMSVAWYNNIVRTTGIDFETSVWGFDGKVSVDESTLIKAAPGRNGIIGITMENTGEEIVFAGVEISKKYMTDDLKKRIYFYIDSSGNANGEISERVYLHNNANYPYILMPGDSITINDQAHDAALVKWEWVYEVQGYYVKGTVEKDKSGADVINNAEYLSPVCYDRNKAEYDADSGELLKVDGKSIDSFLTEISAKDGYAGVVDVTKKAGNYYPVEVDGQTGIWIYLAPQNEIEKENIIDTQLGTTPEGAQKPEITAQLTVTAINGNLVKEEASSVAEVKAALAKGVNYIKLKKSLDLGDDYFAVKSNTPVIVDLNGYTVTSGNFGFAAYENSVFALANGTVEAKKHACQLIGSRASIYNVTLKSKASGVVVADVSATTPADSEVRVSKCKINADASGAWIAGNGDVTPALSKLYITDCEIEGKQYAINGNGNLKYFGTEMQILNSSLKGGYSAVYHPQKESTMTVRGSTLTGYNGITVKGGNVYIYDCTVSGTGERNEPAFTGGGYTDTGDAVYVETNYDWDRYVEIGGNSTLTSRYGYAVECYKPEDKRTKITVTGGSYSTDVTDFVDSGSYTCNEQGGEFVVSPKKQ